MPDQKKTIMPKHVGISAFSSKPVIRDLHRLLSFIPLRPYLNIGLFPIAKSNDLATALGKALWEGHLSIIVTTKKDLTNYQETIDTARLSNVSITQNPKAGPKNHIGSLDGFIIDVDTTKKFPSRLEFQSFMSDLGAKGWLTIIISDPNPQERNGNKDRDSLLSSLSKTAEAVGFNLKQKRDLESSFAILTFDIPSTHA
tara:strand:- start:33449 stop:34045 length:597 start_codon:yes stop_codon:yes gene_type:complete